MIVLTSFGRATLCGKRDIFAYISLAAGCIYPFHDYRSAAATVVGCRLIQAVLV
jgi:hypothetical protein